MAKCPHCGQEMPKGTGPVGDPVLSIPLIARDGQFPVFQSDIDEWQKVFPAVDVPACLRMIRLWNQENPERRKTKKGIRAHITRWLGTEQDKGGGKFPRKPGGKGGSHGGEYRSALSSALERIG